MPDSLALFHCLHPLVIVTTIHHFRRCYNDGIGQNMLLRIIETRNGILLVPLTDEPMSRVLLSELEQWQSLGAESLEMFPYADE